MKIKPSLLGCHKKYFSSEFTFLGNKYYICICFHIQFKNGKNWVHI